MTDFQSHPEIDDELLSAYLDDELSPDERARVDARLASDPGARQMLDQLRSTSQAMKNLPRETVGEDLRESVLRRAEAAMLTAGGGRTERTVRSAAATDQAVSRRDSLPRLTIGRTRRGWVWAAVALAAGLLIMVFQPADEQRGSNLGDVAASRSSEELDKLAIADRADVPELRQLRVGETAASPASGALKPFGESMPMPAAATPAAPAESTPMPSHVASDGVVAPAAPTARASARDHVDELAANGEGAYGRTPAVSSETRAGAEQPARELGALAESSARRQSDDEEKDVKVAAGGAPTGVANGSAPASVAESSRRYAETPPRGAIGGESQLGMAATNQPAPADALAKAPAEARPDDFLVVRVVVAPKAAQANAFDQLLTKYGIEFEALAEGDTGSTSTGTRMAEDRKPIAEESNLDRKIASSRDTRQKESGGENIEDVVLVEAPRKTIELCLAELKQDQANYLGIAVDNLVALPATDDNADKAAAEVAVEEASPATKLATDLGTQFNRGKVMRPENEDYYAKLFYDYDMAGGQAGVGGEGFARVGGGFGGGAREQEKEQIRARFDSFGQDVGEQSGQGRARRFRSSRFDDSVDLESMKRRGTVVEDQSSAATRQFGAMPQQSGPRAKTKSENLQVLFVLRPEAARPATATPSPSTDNRPE